MFRDAISNNVYKELIHKESSECAVSINIKSKQGLSCFYVIRRDKNIVFLVLTFR